MLIQPYSPESEQAALAIVLGSPSHSADLLSQMHVGMFYNPANRLIFEGFTGMIRDEVPIELLACTEYFSNRGILEKVGGASALTELYGQFATPAHFSHYSAILSDRWKQREIIAICQETSTIASGSLEGQSVDEHIAAFTERVLALSLDRQQHKERTFKELCDKAIDDFNEAIKNEGRINGTSTGFSQLDNYTGGHVAGQLWVIGGGTSDGKSAMDQQITLHKASKGIQVATYSFEMPDMEVVGRFFAMDTGIDAQKFKRGFQSREEMGICIRSHGILRNLPITIRDVSGMKLSPLIADIRTLATRGVKHFSIDYAQLVEGDGSTANREAEIAKVSRTLKATAKQLNVSINLLSQLNDDGKLRESRALGFDADVVITLSTPTTQKRDGKTITEERDETKRNCFIGKNRNGKRNVLIPMSFDGSTFTFREIKSQTS